VDVALEDFLEGPPRPPRLADPTPEPLAAPTSLQMSARPPVLEFWLPGPFFSWREKRKEHQGRCPVPKGRGKVARIVPGKGFATVTESPKTRAAEIALITALEPLAPPAPYEACRLDIDFVFVPPSKPLWLYEASLAGYTHVTGDHLGDRDNLHKLLGDALEKALFVTKDSRIVEGDVRKRWGVEPGYQIRFTALREVTSFAEWKAIQLELA